MKTLRFVVIVFVIVVTSSLSLADTEPQSNFGKDTAWPKPVEDDSSFTFILADLLEYQASAKPSFNWDLQAWHGGDINRLWVKTEGEKSVSENQTVSADLQVLYGRLITPFFDFQFGARADQLSRESRKVTRGQLVVGVEGLAVYMYELEALLFVSQKGDISARVTASEDFLLTQRLISQVRIESNAALQRNEEFEVASGLNDASLDLRIRYEFRRELAPYIGVSWRNNLFETASLREADGEQRSVLAAVVGLRSWY
jgi:copper resistance protein B